jgi:glycosyltransferase involved in cell wall biosynthesis
VAHEVEVITVASVPENHVYVRHLSREGDGVRRLPDPRPSPESAPGVWWPPSMLDSAWIEAHADQFDVFHVHFGFDAVTPEHLANVVAALREHRKPLVYTVHDLRNPHHLDPRLHDTQIEVLIGAADELITLTDGAAEEISRRWGRHAWVLPHPHVVDDPWRGQGRVDRRGFVVGVHAKSLRASMAPGPVIEHLSRILDEIPAGRLRVDVHNDVFSPGSPNHDPVLVSDLAALRELGKLELCVHDCFTDDELWEYLLGLDVSVLPYRFGTHSGWLEACHDLGTVVVAPQVGYLAEQRPCLTYRWGDYQSLRTAILRAYRERPQWRATSTDRDHERDRVAASHRLLYERSLSRGGVR